MFGLLLVIATAAADPTPIAPETWIQPGDYPSEAQRRGAEGTMRVVINVGADGRPLTCTVEKSAGDAALDSAACDAIMMRGKFKPAVDGSGKFVSGTYRQDISWRIPDRNPAVILVADIARISLDKGQQKDCTDLKIRGPSQTAGQNEICSSLEDTHLLEDGFGDELPSFANVEVRSYISTVGEDGTAAQPFSQPYNVRVVISEAELKVARDGHLASCTRIGGYTDYDPCPAYQGRNYGAAPDGPELRTAHVVRDVIARNAKPD